MSSSAEHKVATGSAMTQALFAACLGTSASCANCIVILIKEGHRGWASQPTLSLLEPNLQGKFTWEICKNKEICYCLCWLASFELYLMEWTHTTVVRDFRSKYMNRMNIESSDKLKQIVGQSGGHANIAMNVLEYLESLGKTAETADAKAKAEPEKSNSCLKRKNCVPLVIAMNTFMRLDMVQEVKNLNK